MKIKAKEKNYIDLYGVYGNFSIPNSQYVVKYFSTCANNKIKNSGPYRLLQELKPVRERVKPNEIKDLVSLIQRDLNDSRVANELVPYLQGAKNDNIAFFPAILAALLPKDYISNGEPPYPKPRRSTMNEEAIEISYGDKWILNLFLDENKTETSLGMLRIDGYETDIIVLDGQHRANAFRIVTGTFNNNENSIYESFYENIVPSTDFDADLPVTLIWFESTNKNIDPRLISRKLFVDVNNTARPVSASRTILLNDYDPSAVTTRLFYSFLAENKSFNANEFSLLHSGFDVDTDLKDSVPHIITLLTPEIMYDIVEWTLFGTRINNTLDRYTIKRYPSAFTDTSSCARISPTIRKNTSIIQDDDGIYRKYFRLDNDYNEIKEEYYSILNTVYLGLLNEFHFVKQHLEATESLQKLREKKWSVPVQKMVWDKIFCGGEGLYYAYKNVPQKKLSTSDSLRDIIDTIKFIEKEFSNERSRLFKKTDEKRINDAYKSFRTKAFMVGYYMAFFDYLFDHDKILSKESIEKTIAKFFKKINSISSDGWVYILTDLRSNLISGTDPKKWPAYHKIIIRIIQDPDEYYNIVTNRNHSPEARIYYNQLYNKFNSWLDVSGIPKEQVDSKDVKKMLKGWSAQSKKFTEELFELCEIEILADIEWNQINENFLNEIRLSNEESEE